MSGERGAQDIRVGRFLPQLPAGERSRVLLEELVADWRREAGDDSDAAAIFEVLEDEAAEAFKGAAKPEARLAWVHAEVLDRRLRVLSRRALAAARGLLEQGADEAARAEGKAILAEAERISPELAGVEAARAVSLRQALEDVVLEGLYLVERKAMSRRFEELFGAGAPGAPVITDSP